MSPTPIDRNTHAWFWAECVLRCMRCMWLFRSHDHQRTCCRACESKKKGAGGT